MPLTSHRTYSDDLEENRRRFGEFAQGEAAAAKQGTDALAQMQALAAQARAEALKREALDVRKGDLVLRRADAAKKTETDAAELALKKNADARAAEEHALAVPKLQRAEEDAALGKARDTLKLVVREARERKQNPLTATGVAKLAHDDPRLGALTGDEEVVAEYTAQEKADAEAARNAAKKQAEITKLEGDAGKTAREDVDATRKEFNALPSVKNFNEVKTSYEKMQAAAKDPSPAGDIALIYGFMKMQDPTSTVRESEFAAAAMAGSFGDQIKAQVERVVSGKRLTPAQRADFLAQGERFYGVHQNAYRSDVMRYTGIATRRGQNIADIFGASDEPEAAAPPPDAGAFDWEE